MRQHLNLPNGQGVVVLGVAPNSGAAQAGIEQNDILLSLGETPLGKPEDLYDRLKKAGEKPMPLTLLRSGGRITLQVQPLIRVTVRPVVQIDSPRVLDWCQCDCDRTGFAGAASASSRITE